MKIILRALVVVALLTPCVICTLLISLRSLTPDVNISRKNLEDALHKWESQGVVEYKMVVEAEPGYPLADLSGIWTVNVSHGSATVITGPSQPDSTSYMWFLTVDGIFSKISSRVDYSERIQDGSSYAMSVTFDPLLGYPKTLEDHPKPSLDPMQFLLGEDISVKVVALEVLSSR
jgi:Family of unknown function (DUF6174)